jgi:type III secretion protein V
MALGVMAIIGLMVLRMPTFVIDALVAVNIGCGVALLLIAIYMRRAITFNSFPSVLLITTLFRLSLSVATTRLILLDGHAGHIIDAFGHFVAGGNLVVGIVVFIIITIVQFIVIAKGAERVAEVAARFTLDAMPGKQLSIDSDLRAGLIEKDEAKRRRNVLEQESQMNGALDGAMKFVKGDAIASIIIVIVNLLGGLTVGVLQDGLPVGEAAHLYSILSIGDGMVAQIPALLSAMAAGLVVTRAANDGNDSHLGESISRQVMKHPRALLMTALVALLLAGVPGFPSLIFIGMAAVLFVLARQAVSNLHDEDTEALTAGTSPRSNHGFGGSSAGSATDHSSLAHPLAIELSVAASGSVDRATLRRALADTLTNCSTTLGTRLPEPALTLAEPPDAPAWRILIYDEVICAAETGASLDLESLQRRLSEALRRHAERFIGVQEASNLLDKAAEQYPALVREVLRLLSPQKIAEVLRNLLREGIPLRNLRDVLEVLTEWGERERDAGNLTEFVRMGLKRYITARFASADHQIQALVIEAGAEELLRRSVSATSAGMLLMLPPAQVAQLRAHLLAELERIGDVSVLVTAVDIRRYVRQVVEPVRPELQVISYQELLPDVVVHPLGTLRFGKEAV